MKNLVIIIFINTVLFSCNSTENNSGHDMSEHNPLSSEHVMGDERTAEIMAVHDSIMPKMEDIMILKSELKQEVSTIDSVLSLKSTPSLASKKAKTLAMIIQLEEADKAMMGWMHQYKADTLAKLNEEEVQHYIVDQKQKIYAVKAVMLNTIEEAKVFLREK